MSPPSTLNTNGDDEQIYRSAVNCGVLFEQLLKQSSQNSGQHFAALRDHHLRFEHWTEYVGALAEEQASLDDRLKPYPEVRDLVLQMLQMLESNLHHVLQFEPNATTVVKPIDDPTGDRGRPNPKIGAHGTVKLTPEGATRLSASLAVQAALKAVQEAIDRLQRLAIIIRRSSTVTIASRVKNFALKTDAAENAEFNKLVLIRINAILPGISESLASQLLESISHRRLRLLYQRRHQKKLGRRRPGRSNQTLPREAEGEKLKLDSPQRPAMPEAGTGESVRQASVYTKSQANSDTAHSSFNLSAFYRYQSRAASTQSDNITVTSVTQGCSYPRPPKLQEGARTARCDWCYEEISTSELQTSGWWRSHFKKDLEPYVCISEDCVDPPVYFTSFLAWRKHMEQVHMVDWARRVHSPNIWYCDLGPDEYEEFGSASQLRQHITSKHTTSKHTTAFTDAQLDRKLARSVLPSPRKENTCPLCHQDVLKIYAQQAENEAKEKIKAKSSNEAKKARVQAPDGDASSDEEPLVHQSRVSAGSERSPSNAAQDDLAAANRQKVAIHVASHLKSLSLLSIRYIDDDSASEKSEGAALGVNTDESDQDRLSVIAHSDGPLEFQDIPPDERLLSDESLSFEKGSKDGNPPSESFQKQGFRVPKQRSSLPDREANAPSIFEMRKAREDIQAWREETQSQVLREETEQSAKQFEAITSWLKINESDQVAIFDLISSEAAEYQGTCGWIMKNPKIRSWFQNKPDTPTLWLQGSVGTGKSVLCTQLANFMRASDMFIVHHFCTYLYSSSTEYDQILKSLLLQLVRKDADLIAHVYETFVLEKKSPTTAILETLFQTLLSNMSIQPGQEEYAWVLIDGLDECEPEKQTRLIRLINQVTSRPSLPGNTVCKVFISSRAPSNALQSLRRKQIVSLIDERASLHEAIKQYVGERLRPLSTKLRQLDIGETEIDDIREVIVGKADGMFLYARLVMDYLASNIFFSSHELMQSVNQLPQKLAEFYRKILTKILVQLDARSVDRIRCILGWVAFAKRPLQKLEFLSAITFSLGDPGVDRLAPKYILDICGTLIEERTDSTLSFIHLSVKEFLQSSSSNIVIDKQRALHEHGVATVTCLLSGLRVFGAQVPEHERLLRIGRGLHGLHVYATEYWTEYLLSCAGTHDLNSQLMSLACQLADEVENSGFAITTEHDPELPGFDERLSFLKQYPTLHKCVERALKVRSLKNLEARVREDSGPKEAAKDSKTHFMKEGISMMLESYQDVVMSLLNLDHCPVSPSIYNQERDSQDWAWQ
ncbi:hypothetical protein BHE90_004564 [Fusarium euwallaceae]|uniref:NACHT domain-containing protein n=1 Tax=Fusarium euwallaceae TaxID=1147111 RepID=A0A430LYX9_9HYPO|nr:hypothetical protein BHE90_004564 [Fusarium euwallaceae]